MSGTSFHIYIGECCTEWPMAAGYPSGRCGLCGEKPTYLRDCDTCACDYCKASA